MPHNAVTTNRQFVINQLRVIAGNGKNTPVMRLRALDRIAVMEKFYPVVVEDDFGPNATRDKADPQAKVDEGVEKMIRQLKEENNAELSKGVAG